MARGITEQQFREYAMRNPAMARTVFDELREIGAAWSGERANRETAGAKPGATTRKPRAAKAAKTPTPKKARQPRQPRGADQPAGAAAA